MSTGLDTMEPDPAWDPVAHAEAVDALGREGLTFKVWGGDWCSDCRRRLPAFAAALEAAGVPADAVDEHPVEKRDDGSKVGPEVEAYGIERIPTVVVEREGREVARFVEEEPVPIAVHLAERLRAADVDA
ncbi:MAG: thioredoxin [Haloferacaceae archaeon]